jgi:TonB family protein
MAVFVILAGLILGSAAPAAADTSTGSSQRDAQNWEALFSQYPAASLAAGEQGLVGFKVSLDRDGYASGCEVTHSSGHARLDNETCRLILNRAEFKGIKDANGRRVSSMHEGVVNWKLPTTDRNLTMRAPVALAKANAPEKVVCRRRLKTGSLADFERVCATPTDWRRLGERTREEWGELQGSKGSTRE